MSRVATGQIVFWVIRATDGSIGIVPPEFDNALVSDTSYRVFTCDNPEDAAYLWAVLRSFELRADMQSPSTGTSRYSTPWPEVGEVLVPWREGNIRRAIGEKLLRAWAQERQLTIDREEAMTHIDALGVNSPESMRRWHQSKARRNGKKKLREAAKTARPRAGCSENRGQLEGCRNQGASSEEAARRLAEDGTAKTQEISLAYPAISR